MTDGKINGRPGNGKRFTIPNPNEKGYRVWMDQAGTFEIKSQMGLGTFAFGDMVNQLGQLEDLFYGNKK